MEQERAKVTSLKAEIEKRKANNFEFPNDTLGNLYQGPEKENSVMEGVRELKFHTFSERGINGIPVTQVQNLHMKKGFLYGLKKHLPGNKKRGR